jgi:hypothetical protein
MAQGPTAARRPHEEELTRGETAAYLYCIVRKSARPRLVRAPDGLPGSGSPQAVQAAPSMWLILALVPLARYGPDPLADTLRDLDRVAELAVAHEAVVEHVAQLAGATVVPMKMFTMFSSVERAVAEMQQRRRDIAAVLDRVAGCEEWGVRITPTPGPRPKHTSSARPKSGTAFLAARKQVRDEARAAAGRASGAAAVAFSELSALAKESRRRGDAPAGATPPLLDAAFLVPVRSRAKFQSAVRRIVRRGSESGLTVTLTGPWPAYNFVHLSAD